MTESEWHGRVNFGRLQEYFGRVNFGRVNFGRIGSPWACPSLKNFTLAEYSNTWPSTLGRRSENLITNRPRLVRGASGASALARRASLVRAVRLILLRVDWTLSMF